MADKVKSYKEQAQERSKMRQKELSKDAVSVSDLVAADKLFNPREHSPATIAQMTKTLDNSGPRKPGLSPATIDGLRALKESTMSTQQPPTPPTLPPQQAKLVPVPEPPAAAGARSSEDRERQIVDALSELDDLEAEVLLQRVREDAINNSKERKAIETRLRPMDIEEGLASGEFRQSVPIKPEVLVVDYRSVSGDELEEIRKLVLTEAINHPEFQQGGWAGERMGFMLMVASVAAINGQAKPSHLKGSGYSSEFDAPAFLNKAKAFSKYPLPLLHTLQTNAFWFDERVRRLFTNEAVKNG